MYKPKHLKEKPKKEFGKKLLIADYGILVLMLVVLAVLIVFELPTSEWVMVVVAWVAQLAISTGAYYWKAKAENIVKLPVFLMKELMEELPEDMKDKIDPNSIIASVLGIGIH